VRASSSLGPQVSSLVSGEPGGVSPGVGPMGSATTTLRGRLGNLHQGTPPWSPREREEEARAWPLEGGAKCGGLVQ